jgi:hypothetical protein
MTGYMSRMISEFSFPCGRIDTHRDEKDVSNRAGSFGFSLGFSGEGDPA